MLISWSSSCSFQLRSSVGSTARAHRRGRASPCVFSSARRGVLTTAHAPVHGDGMIRLPVQPPAVCGCDLPDHPGAGGPAGGKRFRLAHRADGQRTGMGCTRSHFRARVSAFRLGSQPGRRDLGIRPLRMYSQACSTKLVVPPTKLCLMLERWACPLSGPSSDLSPAWWDLPINYPTRFPLMRALIFPSGTYLVRTGHLAYAWRVRCLQILAPAPPCRAVLYK